MCTWTMTCNPIFLLWQRLNIQYSHCIMRHKMQAIIWSWGNFSKGSRTMLSLQVQFCRTPVSPAMSLCTELYCSFGFWSRPSFLLKSYCTVEYSYDETVNLSDGCVNKIGFSKKEMLFFSSTLYPPPHPEHTRTYSKVTTNINVFILL